MKTKLIKTARAALLVGSVLALGMGQAQAHWGGGGYGGGYYRGGGGYYHGGGGRWVAPALIGGALLGAALATPSYSYSYPVVVPTPVYPAVPAYVPPVVPMATPVQPTGYFCPTSGQFYPNVPTCNVPWRLL